LNGEKRKQKRHGGGTQEKGGRGEESGITKPLYEKNKRQKKRIFQNEEGMGMTKPNN